MNGPYCDSLDQALRVLKLMVEYRALTQADNSVPARASDLPVLRDLPPAGKLTEPEAKRLLASYRVPITREAVAANADEAVALSLIHISEPTRPY